MRLNKIQMLGILTIMGVVAVSGCTSQNQTASNTVNIQNGIFTPSSLTIPGGTTVNWVNLDSTTHTVTSDSDLFNSGNMSKDQSFSYVFNVAGTYTYHCTIHPGETGTIIVTSSTTTPTPSNPTNPTTPSNPSTPSSGNTGGSSGFGY